MSSMKSLVAASLVLVTGLVSCNEQAFAQRKPAVCDKLLGIIPHNCRVVDKKPESVKPSSSAPQTGNRRVKMSASDCQALNGKFANGSCFLKD